MIIHFYARVLIYKKFSVCLTEIVCCCIIQENIRSTKVVQRMDIAPFEEKKMTNVELTKFIR